MRSKLQHKDTVSHLPVKCLDSGGDDTRTENRVSRAHHIICSCFPQHSSHLLSIFSLPSTCSVNHFPYLCYTAIQPLPKNAFSICFSSFLRDPYFLCCPLSHAASTWKLHPFPAPHIPLSFHFQGIQAARLLFSFSSSLEIMAQVDWTLKMGSAIPLIPKDGTFHGAYKGTAWSLFSSPAYIKSSKWFLLASQKVNIL